MDAAEGPLSASSLMMESLMACGRGLTIRQGKEHNAAWAAICVSHNRLEFAIEIPPQQNRELIRPCREL